MKIHIGVIIGACLSLITSYNMWGWKGFLFTLGLLLTNKIPDIYFNW